MLQVSLEDDVVLSNRSFALTRHIQLPMPEHAQADPTSYQSNGIAARHRAGGQPVADCRQTQRPNSQDWRDRRCVCNPSCGILRIDLRMWPSFVIKMA